MQKFIKDNSKKLLALVVASLTVVSLGNMSQVKAESQDTCPDGGDWHKVEQSPYLFNVSPVTAQVIDQICVKGGSDSSSNGYLEYISTNGVQLDGCLITSGIGSQGASVVNGQTSTGSSCAAISHASFHVAYPAVDPTPTPVETTPTPTVTPSTGTPDTTPTPTVEPTTAPVGQASSALGYNGPTCTNNEFEVTMDLKDANGNGVNNVLVTFTYRNEKKEARTNNDGRARVFYSFSGEESVKAEADGFATQHVFIHAPMCPVAGGSTSTPSNNNTETRSNGQVLGASTLAETGMNIWQQALVLGLILSTISSVSLVKNRK